VNDNEARAARLKYVQDKIKSADEAVKRKQQRQADLKKAMADNKMREAMKGAVKASTEKRPVAPTVEEPIAQIINTVDGEVVVETVPVVPKGARQARKTKVRK